MLLLIIRKVKEVMKNKNVLVSTIIGVATLLVLIVGSAYAYFSVEVKDNFDKTEVGNATTGEIGSVTFEKEADSTLTLNVTAMQMLEQTGDKAYYATGSEEEKTIGKIQVVGEGVYSCTYTITATSSIPTGVANNLYTKFQGMTGKSADQIYYTINGQKYDFNTVNLFNGTNNVYTKTVTGLTASNPGVVTANMVLVNEKEVDQTELNNSGITLTYDVTSFSCEMTENFDPTSLAKYLIDNSVSGLDKNIIEGDTLYRFSGTSGNTGINNYICLGTSTKCSSGSDNMYRIIGVEPSTGYVKVIKQTMYGEKIRWHDILFENVIYQNSSSYNQLVTWYNSLSFKNIIVEHIWKVGGIEEWSDSNVGTRSTVISYEDNSTNIANVGMLALSDYYLAYRGDQNWNSSNSNYTNNWIHLANNGNTSDAEWTMTLFKTGSAVSIYSSGRTIGYVIYGATNAVRPTFYLNSTVNRISGSGTSGDPFIVN